MGRRLFRFRLRTLLLLMSILAVIAAFVARPVQAYRDERAALSQIPGSRRITEPRQVEWPSWLPAKWQRLEVYL